MIARTIHCLVSATFACCAIVNAQDKPTATTYFEQDVKDSNPLRAEQAKELDDYILALKKDNRRLQKILPAGLFLAAGVRKVGSNATARHFVRASVIHRLAMCRRTPRRSTRSAKTVSEPTFEP